MTSNKAVIVGFLAVVLLGFGVAYWVADEFVPQPVDGLAEIEIGGRAFAVSDYIGTDHPEHPVQLTGCFRIADPAGALAAGVETQVGASEPRLLPRAEGCKEPEEVRRAARSGVAQAVVAETLPGQGVDLERVVAIFPEGEAYQWMRVKE